VKALDTKSTKSMSALCWTDKSDCEVNNNWKRSPPRLILINYTVKKIPWSFRSVKSLLWFRTTTFFKLTSNFEKDIILQWLLNRWFFRFNNHWRLSLHFEWILRHLCWRNLNRTVVVEAEVRASRYNWVIFTQQCEGFCLVSVSLIYWCYVWRRS
jgi:hypothetical protein